MEKDDKEKPNISIGTIGHVEHGKTTLSAVVDEVIKKRHYAQVDCTGHPDYVLNLIKQGINLPPIKVDDPKDKWPETVKLLAESVEDISDTFHDQERLTYPYTNEKYKNEINKITSNYEFNKDLSYKLKFKAYHQTRKKGK